MKHTQQTRADLRWSNEPELTLRDMAADLSWMRERYEELRSQGLDWDPPALQSASEPRCIVGGQEMIMLSANNYLNLATHPKVVEASIEGIGRAFELVSVVDIERLALEHDVASDAAVIDRRFAGDHLVQPLNLE